MLNKIVLIVIIASFVVLLIASGLHKINKDNCIGCKLCVKNCPVNAISMKDGKAVIDQDKCIECGICINGNGDNFNGCPVNAIYKNTENEKEKAEKNEKNPVYSVQSNNCISCKLCVINCPANAIDMINGKAVIDTEKCIQCGICIDGDGKDFNGCPVNAIIKQEKQE